MVSDMDREWVQSIVGHPVSDQIVVEFIQEFNDWLDSKEQEDSPEFYSGN